MCHIPLTMALSLSSSLPPPALSLYPFLSVWTSHNHYFLTSFFFLTHTNFEKWKHFWPVLQLLTISPLPSSPVKFTVNYQYSSSVFLKVCLENSIILTICYLWQNILKCYITTNALHGYYAASLLLISTRLDLPALIPLWSLHQTQLCIRVTAAHFSIDPDDSHLSKYQEENWQEVKIYPKVEWLPVFVFGHFSLKEFSRTETSLRI